MGHHCRRAKCKVKVTAENEDKKIHPHKPREIQGKVAFCGQVKAFPIARKMC